MHKVKFLEDAGVKFRAKKVRGEYVRRNASPEMYRWLKDGGIGMKVAATALADQDTRLLCSMHGTPR